MSRIKLLLKNRPLLAAYTIMAVGFVGMLGFERYDSDWDEYRRCQTGHDFAEVLRAVIQESFSSGRAIDFTRLPAFGIQTPEVQELLVELSSLNNDGRRAEHMESLLKLVPEVHCEEPELLWFN